MSSTYQLEHFYHGKLFPVDEKPSGFTITANSVGCSVERAQAYFHHVQPGSYAGIKIDDLQPSLSYLRFDEETYLFSTFYRASRKDRGTHPDYHCVVVPADVLGQTTPHTLMVALIEQVFESDWESAPVYEEETRLNPIDVTLPDVAREDAELIEELKAVPGVTEQAMTYMLSAVIEQSLVVVPPKDGFNTQQSLSLVQGISALLPPWVRYVITYSTTVFDAASYQSAQIKLTYNHPLVKKGEPDWIFEWGGTPPARKEHPYAYLVRKRWDQPADELSHHINDLDQYVRRSYDSTKNITDSLGIVARSRVLLENITEGKPVRNYDVLLALASDISFTELEVQSLVDYLSASAQQAEFHDTIRLLIEDARYQPAVLYWGGYFAPLYHRLLSGALKGDKTEPQSPLLSEWISHTTAEPDVFNPVLNAVLSVISVEQWEMLLAQASIATRYQIAELARLCQLDDLALLAIDMPAISDDPVKPYPDFTPYVYRLAGTYGWGNERANRFTIQAAIRGWLDLSFEQLAELLRYTANRQDETRILHRLVDITADLPKALRDQTLANAIAILKEKPG